MIAQRGGRVLVAEVPVAAGGRRVITDAGVEAWEDFMGALARDHPAQSIDTQVVRELIDAFRANGALPSELGRAQRKVLVTISEFGADTLWLFDDVESALVQMADEGFVKAVQDWTEAALTETTVELPVVAPPPAALPGGAALSEAGAVLDSPAGNPTMPPPGFRNAPTQVDAGNATAPPPGFRNAPAQVDAGNATAPPPGFRNAPTQADAGSTTTAAPVANPPAAASVGAGEAAARAAGARAVRSAVDSAIDGNDGVATDDVDISNIRTDVDALTDFFEAFEGTPVEYNELFDSLDHGIADQVQVQLEARERELLRAYYSTRTDLGEEGWDSFVAALDGMIIEQRAQNSVPGSNPRQDPITDLDRARAAAQYYGHSGKSTARRYFLNPQPSGFWQFTDGRWRLEDTVDAVGAGGLEPVIARVPLGPDGGSLSASYFTGGLVLGSERFLFGGVPGELVDSASPDDLVFEPDSPRLKKYRDRYLRSSGAWSQDFDDQWAIKRVGFTWDRESAWRVPGVFEHDVVVAVIDSGANWHHPDLTDTPLWRNENEIAGNGIDDDGNGYVDDLIGWNFVSQTNVPWDRDGHGTFVAGLIGALTDNNRGIAGINPKARIMALKAMDDAGRTRASFLTQAIVYAADMGARVINLSVGGLGLSRAEQAAVDYAYGKGAVVVAAAGNEGEEVAGYSPAGLDRVITVASTDHDDRRAPSSNWGRGIDIAAPGVDVLSLRAPGTDLAASVAGADYDPEAAIVGEDRAYYRASGTSFAVAIVSGVASLMLSRDPTLTNQQVERILLQSARDAEAPGFDRYTGHGIVDARAALTADPAFFVEAAISGVRMIQKDGKQVLAVSGTASADRFGKAWVEVGRGDDPNEWTVASEELVTSVDDGPVAEVDVQHFQGAKRFTLRLVVEHENGRRREARFTLDVG